MNNQGIQTTYAGRYLMHMLTDLIEHSDELGFSIYDASGNLLSLSEIIARLEERLEQFSTDEERAAYLTEIFGAQGMRAALALLHASYAGKEGSEALRALTEALSRAGTAEAIFQEQMNTLTGVLARARARIQDAMLAIGEALAPAVDVASRAFSSLMRVLARALAPFLAELAKFMSKVLVLMERIGSYASEVLEPMGKVLLEALSHALDVLGRLVDKLAENEGLVKALAYSLVGLFLALNSVLVVLTACALLMEKSRAVGDRLRSVVEAIREALEGLVEWLREARKAISDFFGGIAEAAKGLYDELVGRSIWPDMLEEMSDTLSYHMGRMEEEFSGALSGIEGALRSFWRSFPSPRWAISPFWTPVAPGAYTPISIHIHIGHFTARGPDDVEFLAQEVCRRIARELRLMGVYVA